MPRPDPRPRHPSEPPGRTAPPTVEPPRPRSDTIRTPRTTPLAALLAVSLLVAGCGGDDDTADDADDAAAEDVADDVAVDEEPAEDGDDGAGADGGEAAAGAGFGSATGTLAITGAVEETYEQGADGVTMTVAGGCSGSQFGLAVQINDATPQTVAQLGLQIDQDLGGGTTGTFDVEDLELNVFDWSDGLTQTGYDGSGTLDVQVHDAPAELNERRMVIVVTGQGLEGGDGAVDVTAELDWVMGCPVG